MSENECDEFPPSMRQVTWRVDKVEENLKTEILERKETDKVIFEKFDKMNNMIVYQLSTAVLTLVVVILVYMTK